MSLLNRNSMHAMLILVKAIIQGHEMPLISSAFRSCSASWGDVAAKAVLETQAPVDKMDDSRDLCGVVNVCQSGR